MQLSEHGLESSRTEFEFQLATNWVGELGQKQFGPSVKETGKSYCFALPSGFVKN